MLHHFKAGDRVLFAYEEDLMDGIVQHATEDEIIVQFSGFSSPSTVNPSQLQYIEPMMEVA